MGILSRLQGLLSLLYSVPLSRVSVSCRFGEDKSEAFLGPGGG